MKQSRIIRGKRNVLAMLVLIMVFALCACGMKKSGEDELTGIYAECVPAGFYMENRDDEIRIFTSAEELDEYYKWVYECLTNESENASEEGTDGQIALTEQEIKESMINMKSVFVKYDETFFEEYNLVLNQFKVMDTTELQVSSIEVEEEKFNVVVECFNSRNSNSKYELQNVLVAVEKKYAIDTGAEAGFEYVEIYLSDEEMERRFGEGADIVDYGNEIEFDVKYDTVSVDFEGNYHDAMIIRSMDDLEAYYSWAEKIWVDGYLSNNYVMERYEQDEWVGDKMTGMKECFVDYDASFFEDKILVLKYESPGSGSVEFEVEKVLWGENNGEKTLEIVTKASSPECMTSDDPKWYIYIEIDKEFDVQESNIIDTEERVYYIEDEGYFKRNG